MRYPEEAADVARRAALGPTQSPEGVLVNVGGLSQGTRLSRRRLLFVVTEGEYFVTHRLPLAEAIRRAGWEVAIATHPGSQRDVIERSGVQVVPLSWRRRRGGLAGELLSLVSLSRFCREWQPDVVFSVALKPALLSGGLCRALGFRRQIIAIAGLGHAFSGRGSGWVVVRRGVTAGLRWICASDTVRVIVQNAADEAFAKTKLGLQGRSIVRFTGVGVDLERFAPRPFPETVSTFVYAGRLLRSKGVLEFLEAARDLRREGVALRCLVAGEPDEGSFDSIRLEELEPFTHDGTAIWLGRREDVPEVLGESHVVVLPTRYGEGVPKILLEAAAVGRPVIASDSPGCRAVVSHRATGLLVATGDRDGLRDAMRELALDRLLVRNLGEAARAKAVSEFSVEEVNRATLELLNELAGEEQRPPASVFPEEVQGGGARVG